MTRGWIKAHTSVLEAILQVKTTEHDLENPIAQNDLSKAYLNLEYAKVQVEIESLKRVEEAIFYIPPPIEFKPLKKDVDKWCKCCNSVPFAPSEPIPFTADEEIVVDPPSASPKKQPIQAKNLNWWKGDLKYKMKTELNDIQKEIEYQESQEVPNEAVLLALRTNLKTLEELYAKNESSSSTADNF